MSHYSTSSASELRRPRSSFGQNGAFAASIGPGHGGYGGYGGHGHSQSVNNIAVDFEDLDLNYTPNPRAPTPTGRRSIAGESGIPMPGRRQSGGLGSAGSTAGNTPQPRRMERKMSGAVRSSVAGLRNESRAGIAERKREREQLRNGAPPVPTLPKGFGQKSVSRRMEGLGETF